MLCDILSNELVSISSSQILTDILFSMVTSSGNLNLMETFKYSLHKAISRVRINLIQKLKYHRNVLGPSLLIIFQ